MMHGHTYIKYYKEFSSMDWDKQERSQDGLCPTGNKIRHLLNTPRQTP